MVTVFWDVTPCMWRMHAIVSEEIAASIFSVQELLKSSNFWDITLCSPMKVNRRFRGICLFHLPDRSISQSRNWCESRWQVEQCYVSEDRTLHNYLCENFTSCIQEVSFCSKHGGNSFIRNKFSFAKYQKITKITKLRDRSPQANYTNRATAACRRN
jgi:hypothetical protein